MDSLKFPTETDLVHLKSCPVCSSNMINGLKSQVGYIGVALQYNNCKACNHIFMNPRPTQHWYDDLYRNHFWEVKSIKESGRGTVEYQIRKEARWADKLISLLTPFFGSSTCVNPRFLEVGCAYGVIGKTLSHVYRGESYCVEPSDHARSFAEHFAGTAPIGRTLEDVDLIRYEGYFDLIIFSHVLENIIDQRSALLRAWLLLKDGGLLIVDTPNNFVRKSWHIHHPHCFTLPSLVCLLGRCRFQVLGSRLWGRPKYLIGNIYLSVVAKKSTIQMEKAPARTVTWKLQDTFGAVAFLIFNRGIIGRLNRFLATKRWAISREADGGLAKILEKYTASHLTETEPK